MLKDPDTGKRISGVNPRDEWQAAEAPHLRIVDAETWERVQALKSSKSQSPKHEHRRPSVIVTANSASGVQLRRRAVPVKAPRVFRSNALRRPFFEGMREHLRDPRLIEVYVCRYNAEREKALSNAVATRTRIEARLARLTARRDHMIDLLVDGLINDAEGRARVAAIKEEQLALKGELRALGNLRSL